MPPSKASLVQINPAEARGGFRGAVRWGLVRVHGAVVGREDIEGAEGVLLCSARRC